MGRGKKKKNKGQNIAILDILSDTRTCEDNEDFILATAVESKETISVTNTKNKVNESILEDVKDKESKKTDSNLNLDIDVDNDSDSKNNNQSPKEITIYDKYFYITRFLNYNWHKINCYNEIEPIIIEDTDSDEDSDYYNYDEY